MLIVDLWKIPNNFLKYIAANIAVMNLLFLKCCIR